MVIDRRRSLGWYSYVPLHRFVVAQIRTSAVTIDATEFHLLSSGQPQNGGGSGDNQRFKRVMTRRRITAIFRRMNMRLTMNRSE
jgi:hypothetical protein